MAGYCADYYYNMYNSQVKCRLAASLIRNMVSAGLCCRGREAWGRLICVSLLRHYALASRMVTVLCVSRGVHGVSKVS